MKALLYNSDTDTWIKKDYPAKWGTPVKDLDSNLEWYEISLQPYDAYNHLQYKLTEVITATEDTGDFLKIAQISYILTEYSQEEVISNLNNAVGNHLDTQFPEWERSKHAGISLRFAQVLIGGGSLTAYEQSYLNYIIETADWCRDCRLQRDSFEQLYLTNGILPTVSFENRPEKSY